MDEMIQRPQAEKRKISSRNEFELCYLRHQYFRKVTHNPNKEQMKPYLNISAHLAKNTFFTYRNLFHMVGFELDDIINIGQIHLVSFLGLFALEAMPEKMADFVEIFCRTNKRSPDAWDLLQKNRANFTMFLKQRMEDVVRVCRQKARNIKGLPTEEFYVFAGANPPPTFLRDLVENYEKLGYRKLDIAVFKSIKKKVKTDGGPVFRVNSLYYVAVPVDQKALSLVDFSGAGMDPYDSLHNMTPEQVYFSNEENKQWDRLKSQFDSKPVIRRVSIIKKFIENNRYNPVYKEELRAARKMLKELSNNV